MADEAYRAVFLRVHPTGKMVLSLTTDADGKRARLRGSSSAASSACRRSTSRSSPPTPTASASVTATTRARPAARRRRSPAPPRRSATRRGCSRAWRSTPPPETLDVVQRRLGRRRRRRPDAGQDDRGRRALRARHRRAAAGRRGRARRADGLPRLARSTLAVERDLDLVEHLQRAAQRGVRLHAPVGLRDDGGARRACRRRRRRGRTRSAASCRPASARPPRCRPLGRALHARRAEHDVLALEDLVVDRLMDVGLVVVAERLHPARPLLHAQRGRVGGQLRRSSRRRPRRPRASPPRR